MKIPGEAPETRSTRNVRPEFMRPFARHKLEFIIPRGWPGFRANGSILIERSYLSDQYLNGHASIGRGIPLRAKYLPRWMLRNDSS